MLRHVPVLLQETLRFLDPGRGGLFLDATFGGGGHSRALLASGPEVRVQALDCDPAAGARALELERDYPGRFTFAHQNFRDLGALEVGALAGALFDFGVSSFQLDEEVRGFSFRHPAPLDLRMNPEQGSPASQFLEEASRDQLVWAVRDLGEEPRWRQVVETIIAARGTGQLAETTRFAELVATRAAFTRGHRTHPATRTFQGIRLAVNGELEAIEKGLPAAMEHLEVGHGVLVAISFHSLEDRLVKRLFRRWAGRPEHAGDDRTQDQRSRCAELLNRKPISPGAAELEANPRSRSARLRALRKTHPVSPPQPGRP